MKIQLLFFTSLISISYLHAADNQPLPMMLVSINTVEILERLKTGNYEVNAPVDYYEKTILYYACRDNCKELVEALIQKGANVNHCAVYRETPLHDAAHWGCTDIVRILLQSGANKEIKTYSGKTPADLARKNGHNDIAELIENYEHTEDIKEPECN